MKNSPYLKTEDRLADVIAAIQATGTYKYYKLDFEGWADRITGDKNRSPHWRAVFEEHPEFFRLDSARERASLIVRRQRQKLYNVDDETIWPKERYAALTDEHKERFSRLPLTPHEIQALISVAINLHTRAAETAKEKRWLLTLIVPLVGALLGGVLTQAIMHAPQAPALVKSSTLPPARTGL